MTKRWIQKAVDDPGRVHEYLDRVYGERAFFEDGTIKIKYIDKAIKRIEKGPGHDYEGLVKALRLAKRLKRMNK